MKMPQADFTALKNEMDALKVDMPLTTRTEAWNMFHRVMSRRDRAAHRSGYHYMYNTLRLDDSNIETALRQIAGLPKE